jgi:hypothetical protein
MKVKLKLIATLTSIILTHIFATHRVTVDQINILLPLKASVLIIGMVLML